VDKEPIAEILAVAEKIADSAKTHTELKALRRWGAGNALILVARRSNPVRRIDSNPCWQKLPVPRHWNWGKLEDSYSGDVPGDSCK
jgi:hypothetical protein